MFSTNSQRYIKEQLLGQKYNTDNISLNSTFYITDVQQKSDQGYYRKIYFSVSNTGLSSSSEIESLTDSFISRLNYRDAHAVKLFEDISLIHEIGKDSDSQEVKDICRESIKKLNQKIVSEFLPSPEDCSRIETINSILRENGIK